MHPSVTKRVEKVQDGPNGMPHLAGPAAHIRQVMAASFVDGLDHIVEIGGHLSPISAYLHHVPKSFLCIDPKAEPLEADRLNGRPCRVRHVARKFQDVDIQMMPGSYGLVFVGYSLKPFGSQDPLGEKLFSLIDNSALTVLEYPCNLERATSQIEQLVLRPGLETVATINFTIKDGFFETTEYGERHLVVLKPV